MFSRPRDQFDFASLALDPIPFVRGLSQLIPERRLGAILTRTDRASERRRRLPADSVIWLVVAMALFAADSIPKVWRRLHPNSRRARARRVRLHPGPPAPRRRPPAPTLPRDGSPHGHPPDRRGLLPRLAADGPGRHRPGPARHPGQRPRLRPARHRPRRRGLPPGPPAGPVRVGHPCHLRAGDQAAAPQRARRWSARCSTDSGRACC